GRRRASGRGMFDRGAGRPEGDRLDDRDIPSVALRYPLRPPGALQLELLQERPLPAPEVPRGGRGGQPASGRWLRATETRVRRPVDAARLHGARLTESSE